MRCKVGDLAVIVGAKHKRNLGLIVHVICPGNANNHRINEVFEEIDGERYRKHQDVFSWYVESCGREIEYGYGKNKKSGPCPDSILIPIRDNPGQDETLQWAPVPHKETA